MHQMKGTWGNETYRCHNQPNPAIKQKIAGILPLYHTSNNTYLYCIMSPCNGDNNTGIYCNALKMFI